MRVANGFRSPTPNSQSDARSLPPHPVLLRDLQLLQLQPRPVRRGAEGALRRRARSRDRRSGRRPAGPAVGRSRADTIFFGGGTPSLLEPDEIARDHRAPAASRSTSPPTPRSRSRRTPRSVTEARLAAYRARRRQPPQLRRAVVPRRRAARASRACTAPIARARRSREARAAGFDNVSLDLMMWLPEQRVERVARVGRRGRSRSSPSTCRSTCSRSIRTRRSRTRWRAPAGRRRPTTTWRTMYLAAMERLEAAGYAQYEISNVARPGRRSRHNLKYWTDGEWLGFGCGAHSTRDGVRWKNVSVHGGVHRRRSVAAATLAVDVRPPDAGRTARRRAVHRPAAG